MHSTLEVHELTHVEIVSGPDGLYGTFKLGELTMDWTYQGQWVKSFTLAPHEPIEFQDATGRVGKTFRRTGVFHYYPAAEAEGYEGALHWVRAEPLAPALTGEEFPDLLYWLNLDVLEGYLLYTHLLDLLNADFPDLMRVHNLERNRADLARTRAVDKGNQVK